MKKKKKRLNIITNPYVCDFGRHWVGTIKKKERTRIPRKRDGSNEEEQEKKINKSNTVFFFSFQFLDGEGEREGSFVVMIIITVPKIEAMNELIKPCK